MYKLTAQKKVLVIVAGVLAIVALISITLLVLRTKSTDSRSKAGEVRGLSLSVSNTVNGVRSLTQLDTYVITIMRNGVRAKGPFQNFATYCPPGVAKPTDTRLIQRVDLANFKLTKYLGKCVSYVVNFSPYTLADGTINADLGKLAVDGYPSLIGDYYMKFKDTVVGDITQNEAHVRVNKLDMTSYWTMNPDEYYIYDGYNPKANVSGTVYADYVKQDNWCSKENDLKYGNQSITHRILGSNKYMYWHPAYSALDQHNGMPAVGPAEPVHHYVTPAPGVPPVPFPDPSFHEYLTFNYERMKKSNGEEYMGSNYWNAYLSNPALDVKLANGYSKDIDNALNLSRDTHQNSNTSIMDASRTTYSNGNLLYFPLMLDLSDVYATEETTFWGSTPGQAAESTCDRIFRKTEPSTWTDYKLNAMHQISFYAHKNQYGYGVVVSLKEVYKNDVPDCKTIADLRAGKCPNLLREDYYTNKNVGYTGIKTANYGKVGFISNTAFPGCTLANECLSNKTIKDPTFIMNLKTKGRKTGVDTTNVFIPTKTASPVAASKHFSFKVNTKTLNSYIGTTGLESFQIVLDEKGGYAPICGTAKFSTNTNGGLRLMFNEKSWVLGTPTLKTTTNQANMYFYNPASTKYDAKGNNISSNVSAASSYGWFALGSGIKSVTTYNGFKLANLTYTKDANGVWTINFDLSTTKSTVNLDKLNPYFFYQKTGTQQNWNQLGNVQDFNAVECKGQIFNKVEFR